jgi:Holliday junction DNA helicase RuvA
VYALIQGVLEDAGPPTIVLAGGVGYELWVPERARRRLPPIGSPVRLYTHLISREDGLSLYGFPIAQERELFRLLIGVSGIGPKLALSILGDEEAEDAFAAIRAGEPARLTRIKGIGRKTAERLIVELRDKASAWLPVPRAAVTAAAAGPEEEAALALAAMGVDPERARVTIAGLESAERHGSVEELVRAALQRIPF